MKAQGLPISTIVIIVLAVLVLVLVSAAFIPTVRHMMMSILGIGRAIPADAAQKAAFKEGCSTACRALDNMYAEATIGRIAASDFCRKNLLIYDQAVCANLDHCYRDQYGDLTEGFLCTGHPEEIYMGCSFRLIDGKLCSMDPSTARACCKNPTVTNCNCA